MRRVSVVGNSGSGKTTLARRLAKQLDVPHLELDAIFHQAGWSELSTEEFRARVGRFVEGPGWVVDGNYAAVRDLVWARADTVVWLDLPRQAVMRQLARRTLSRVVLRRTLWNGNRERWTNLLSRKPDRSILAWAWTMHRSYQHQYAAAMAEADHAHIDFVVIRRGRDCDALLTAARSPVEGSTQESARDQVPSKDARGSG